MKILRLFFSFYGRINRTHYLLGYLFGWVVLTGLVWLLFFNAELVGLTPIEFPEPGQPLGQRPSPPPAWVFGFIPLGLLAAWSDLALRVKRGHDRGHAGLLTIALSTLIPVFNVYWGLTELVFGEGDPEANLYGDPPHLR